MVKVSMAVIEQRPTLPSSNKTIKLEGRNGAVDDNEEWMITTTDNPFDPFEDFKSWMSWDMGKGYNTMGLLARLTYTSDELSDADQSEAMRHAMLEIVEFNISGVHTIVTQAKTT